MKNKTQNIQNKESKEDEMAFVRWKHGERFFLLYIGIARAIHPKWVVDFPFIPGTDSGNLDLAT